MCRRFCIFLICTLFFAGALIVAGVEGPLLGERVTHGLSGRFGCGCIYAKDVEITTEQLLRMDEKQLEQLILEKSDYEMYKMPCMANGAKNPDTRLPNDDYPQLPEVALEKSAYRTLQESISQEEGIVVPIELEITGGLNGRVAIMVHIKVSPAADLETPGEPRMSAEPQLPREAQTPLKEIPQEPSLSEHEENRMAYVAVKEADGAVKKNAEGSREESKPAEPTLVGDAAVSFSAQKVQADQPGQEKKPLAILLFSLTGLTGIAFGLSIRSDIRIIRWFNRKRYGRR